METHVAGVGYTGCAQENVALVMPNFLLTASRFGIKFIPGNISSQFAGKIGTSLGGRFASAPILHHTGGALMGDNMKSVDAMLQEAETAYELTMRDGIRTLIPVLPGPGSSLLLLPSEAFGSLPYLINKILSSYKKTLAKLKALGASCIQFDEPMLVKDLESHKLEAFTEVYSGLEPSLAGLDVLVQTYNGNVTPAAYKTLIALKGVTAIGFDLVRGTKNIHLIKSEFPSGKCLFAGVVDAMNIRPNDLTAPLNILHSIKHAVGGKIVVSTSGPLMLAGVDNVKDPVLVKEIESSWLEYAVQKFSEVKAVASEFSAGHVGEIISFRDTQRRNADREQKIKLLEFDQRLLDTAEELEAHGDRLNMVEEQASRALSMYAGNNAPQKARKWLQCCSCFK